MPLQSDFETLRRITELKKKLKFTPEEIKKYKIAHKGSQIVWDVKGTDGKNEFDIKIVKEERVAILKSLEGKSKEKKATKVHLALYDKVKLFDEEMNKEPKSPAGRIEKAGETKKDNL